MEDVGLKIKISADVRNALLNIANLTDATGELAVEGVGNITAINQALKELRDAQKDVGNPKELATLNRAIKDLSAESARLRKVGVEGFNEFGEKAKESSSKVLGFANTAFSSLRKVAYLLPGVGLAGLIGALADGVVDFFRSSSKEAEEAAKVNREYFSTFQTKAPLDLEQAKATLKEYQKILTDTITTAGKETAQVDILVARLKEGNLTREQTVDVIKKLQSIAPDYFSKLNAEKATINDVTEAYNKYNQALISSIEAQIRIAEITNLVKDRLNFARQAPDAAKFVNDLLSQGKSLDDISKLVTADFRKQNDAAIRIGQANKTNSAELQKQLDLTDKVPFGVSTIIDYLRKEQDLLKQIGNAPLKDLGVDAKGAKDSAKTIDDLLQKIKQAQDELSKPDKSPIFRRQEQSLLPDDFNGVSLLRQKIADAIEEGGKIGTDRSRTLAKELADLYEQQIKRIQLPRLLSSINFTLANPTDVTKASEKLESQVTKEFGKPIKADIPIEIKAELESFDQGRGGISLHQAIQDAAKNLGNIAPFTLPIRIQLEKKEIQDQLDKQLGEALNFNNLLSKTEIEGFQNIGQSIGEAIASGESPIEAAGKSILSTLGSLIEDIGKSLISYGVVKQGLDTVLTAGISLPGAVAIALGIAAEALGALLKSSGQSYHAFATGGIVTGPTLGLVGEAGPEVIFPLNQLNRFIQGTRGAASTDVNVRGVISGNNIRLALARSNKQQGLV